MKFRFALGAAVGAAVLAVACGGGSPNTPTAPSTPTTGTAPSGGTAPNTLTVTAAGVRPSQLRISPGSKVTFVNSDTVQHQFRSDPHPAHSDCPPINALPMLAPGQSAQTDALTLTGTCGFHDHLNAGNASLRGQILVGVNEPGPGPGYSTAGNPD